MHACVCVCVCACVCVCVYDVFLSQLSLNELLGCFYVLATINSTAINIGVHVSF